MTDQPNPISHIYFNGLYLGFIDAPSICEDAVLRMIHLFVWYGHIRRKLQCLRLLAVCLTEISSLCGDLEIIGANFSVASASTFAPILSVPLWFLHDQLFRWKISR